MEKNLSLLYCCKPHRTSTKGINRYKSSISMKCSTYLNYRCIEFDPLLPKKFISKPFRLATNNVARFVSPIKTSFVREVPHVERSTDFEIVPRFFTLVLVAHQYIIDRNNPNRLIQVYRLFYSISYLPPTKILFARFYHDTLIRMK